MGRPPIGSKAMTDAERQRRRRQRLAAEQLWDAAEEAERIKRRLESRGRLSDADIQALIAALRSNVTSRVTKSTVGYIDAGEPPPVRGNKRAQEREEIGRQMRRQMEEDLARARAAPAEKLKRLKPAMAAAHPDKGGASEEFMKARAEYLKYKSEFEEEKQRRAEAEQKHKKRSEASRAVWQRRKARGA